MDDEQIIELYRKRDEDAIAETSAKYGKLCAFIAGNILKSPEDVEEIVNDTYLGLWNAIPKKRPDRLSAFVGRVARNLALKRYDYNSAAKRNPEAVCSMVELCDCVSGRESVESELENRRVERAIDDFLWAQSEEKRNIFILRYWYFEPVRSIGKRMGYSESKVKSILFHMRRNLREHLESEGIEI